MTNECLIRLLLSKSYAYKAGFERATANGDTAAAKKWKEGYQLIKEKVYELREN